ncbi:MAG TPA: type II toxin-antitoxin system prevent-host-death family antitoxin [Candidatus Polarisedimenticolaceae bacterium]|jgi:prevent-host-death family protein
MKKRWSIAEARAQLPTLVRSAEKGGVVELTRRGEAVAILVGKAEFDRLASAPGGFWEALEAFRGRHDLLALDLDPEEILAGARPAEPGRKVRL